ncbi:MAG: succinylglutamate desuccinylase/aspartoacylase family protein [Armatimonadota bacterium]|nr:succinylglutamate desuccinylase/aspartoacylase family protein [Armatimonadota bacterium]
MKRTPWSALGFAAVAVLVAAASGRAFLAMRVPEPIFEGPGVSRQRSLAAYNPLLRGRSADTSVYFLDGARPGGTVLVLGGTHPNEPAGYLAAVLLVERARVAAGRLIVVPRANGSAFTHNDPQEASPQTFEISTPGGPRIFRFGSRNTNPIDQWPDPDVYVHASSGQRLSGSEVRNLNRAFPGRPDGTFTEQIALAITTLARAEEVDLVIDLHEASPEYPVINAIVAHERAMPLAAAVLLEMQMAGIQIGLEPSPRRLRGLSHRELGDHTPALAVLMETPNPSQGRIRGRTSAELVTGGRDATYERAAAAGRLFVPFDPGGWPIEVRVGRHLAGVGLFAARLGTVRAGRAVVLDDLPDLAALRRDGLGRYLSPPRP